MVKLSAQQCYDQACVVYEKAKGIVNDLTKKAQEVEKEFNGDIAMRQFDLIAQAVMLNIAVLDGKFNDLEKTFISNITEYSDILLVVNKAMKESNPEWVDVTWDVIDALTPENKVKFAFICADTVHKFANEFTFFFSIVDYIDEERNYYDELLECLFNLITFISAVDEGGFDPEAGATEENIRGLNVLKVLFADTWGKNLDTFVEGLKKEG